MTKQGLGFTTAAQLFSRLIDKAYKKMSAKNGGVGKPEFRLRKSYACKLYITLTFSLCSTGYSRCILSPYRTIDNRVDRAGARTLDCPGHRESRYPICSVVI